MTADEKDSPPKQSPLRLRPWLVVVAALIFYLVCLNRWVTLASLPVVSKITGWDWHALPLPWRPGAVTPLFLLLTLPIRILPVSWEPVALNVFSAVCAALTLGVLAASIRLLPHDRTREQRQREAGEDSLLSVRMAFLPALFAVVMLGLQLTFWRHATDATGEMLDALIFSILIFCLLKFRVSQNDNWLLGFSLIYGVGVTNNWALIGFFPCFLIALIWIRGVTFFNGRFLLRMSCWGAAGLLLYLVVPAVGSLTDTQADFLGMLRQELGAQSFILRQIPRSVVLLAAVPTLLPLLFVGIRWPSFEGEVSAAGNLMTRFMFRLLHIVFLLLALVMFFDIKISPAKLLQELPIPFLSFYYIAALCIGYYCGYVLLVFGRASTAWERQTLLDKTIDTVIVVALCVLAVAAPCKLVYQNLSHIMAGHKNVLADFSSEVAHELPPKGAIVLADDPARLYLLDAEYRREGKPDENILIDTTCLPNREYLQYLVARYPQLKKIITQPANLRRVLNAEQLVQLLFLFSKSFNIYYLQPSFGYYFEAFYLKPHGLVYDLRVIPREALTGPAVNAAEIQENESVWSRLKPKLDILPPLANLDQDVSWVSVNYSVCLDVWGVDLQRAGRLPQANARFVEATNVDPQNFIAKINLEYNQNLQKNNRQPVDRGDLFYKAVNFFHGLTPILKFNGPPDEPDMILKFGTVMGDGHDMRQAAALFQRRLDLLPGDPPAELALAQTMVDMGRADKALELVRQLRTNPRANKWQVSRVEALAYYNKGDYPTAEKLMLQALHEDPNDEKRFAILADFYRGTAYAALKEKKPSEAERRFKNSLTYLAQELQALQAPGHHDSGPGVETVPNILLKKAEVEMMLKAFQDSIKSLDQIIELQPKNATAILNRAIAETQLHQYQAAKSDYQELRRLMPAQPWVIEFGLAEVANQEKNTGEELFRLKRYLKTAPDDTQEYNQIKQRVAKLQTP